MSKIIFSIQYAGLTLPVIKNDKGEDVTPLKPIADLFGLKWEEQRKKVTNSDYLSRYLGVCTPVIRGADDQNREQNCIRVSRVAAYLMSINPERVQAAGNEDGAQFLMEKQEEWADALHDYEEIGVAVNVNHVKSQELLRKQRFSFAQMIGIKNQTSNPQDRQALGQVTQQMAAELGITYQLELDGEGKPA